MSAGTALVGGGVCLHDPCFQTSAAGCQLVETSLYALLFDLQLASTLLAQFFRARAAYSRQTLLDVLGFQILFELLQAGFQFRLLCLYLSQLLARSCAGFCVITGVAGKPAIIKVVKNRIGCECFIVRCGKPQTRQRAFGVWGMRTGKCRLTRYQLRLKSDLAMLPE